MWEVTYRCLYRCSASHAFSSILSQDVGRSPDGSAAAAGPPEPYALRGSEETHARHGIRCKNENGGFLITRVVSQLPSLLCGLGQICMYLVLLRRVVISHVYSLASRNIGQSEEHSWRRSPIYRSAVSTALLVPKALFFVGSMNAPLRLSSRALSTSLTNGTGNNTVLDAVRPS